MSNGRRCFGHPALVTILLLVWVSPLRSQQTWYPDEGEITFDGGHWFYGFFSWSDPGGWSVSNPRYEHWLYFHAEHWTDCYVANHLPNPSYDTCGSWFGVAYDPVKAGTTDVTAIVPGYDYHMSWDFYGNTGANNLWFTVEGAEVSLSGSVVRTMYLTSGVADAYTCIYCTYDWDY